MKHTSFKLPVLAFALAAIIAFTQSAFTPVKTVKYKVAAVQYAFNGTTLAQDKSASNYTAISPSNPAPTCAGASLPCIVSVEGDLQTWLNARTPAQIRDQAVETKD
jgi:hypothetical protein